MGKASQADLALLEQTTHDKVRAKPFPPVTGTVTWEHVEQFEEYARDVAITIQPSF